MIKMPQISSLAVASVVFVSVATLVPAEASAQEHPLVERARQASDRAEFDQAMLLLAELPMELEFSRDDLRAALLLRASLAYALDDEEGMERDLARLARFTRPNELPDDLSPLLRTRFAVHFDSVLQVFINADVVRAGGRLRVELESSPIDDLVQGVRLFVRRGGESEWTEREVDQGFVELDDEEGLELYVELIGLGGAVLATSGSRSEPLTTPAPRRRVRAWPFVVGALVLGAVAVGLGVGLGREDQEERLVLSAPSVSWE